MTTLVTGGTGSFGNAFVKFHDGSLRVLSRDEEKQRAMAVRYPGIDFRLGDVRDRDSLRRAMEGVTHVFHAAALKQVPQSESNPGEYVRTNIIGTENVCTVAREFDAKVVLLSTDKAVLPVGVMGATKMLAEAIVTDFGFNAVRYGNVVGSRGSIIPLFRSQMARGVPITVTDPEMTRFLITLPEAVGLIGDAMNAPMDGTIYVRKSPAATVRQVVDVLAPGYPWKVIGIRPGEKRHEDLIAAHEQAEDCGWYFKVRRNVHGGFTYGSLDAPTLSDEELEAVLREAPDEH